MGDKFCQAQATKPHPISEQARWAKAKQISRRLRFLPGQWVPECAILRVELLATASRQLR